MKKDCENKIYLKDHKRAAEIFKALSNPKRINILLALREEKCRVGNMAKCLNEAFPIISQQLAILKRCGLVTKTRNKKNEIYYSVADEFADEILDLIEKKG
ncbi:MAG: metalloregulator ArsR/SmtB family transcription factor [Candidatus Delongbacteria bacterium]